MICRYQCGFVYIEILTSGTQKQAIKFGLSLHDQPYFCLDGEISNLSSYQPRFSLNDSFIALTDPTLAVYDEIDAFPGRNESFRFSFVSFDSLCVH